MPWIPFVKNGFFGSKAWTPLVKGNGLTAGGDEPEPPVPVPTYTTVTGFSPIALLNAIQLGIRNLAQFGKCTQASTPTPSAPVDIVCNNGALRYGAVGKNLVNITSADIEQGAISSADGSNSGSASHRVRTIGYYPVKPNTQYTISCVIDGYTSGSSKGVFILEYSSDSVSGYTGDSSGWKSPDGYTFTTGATTNFIRIVFAKGSSTSTPTTPADISNVQLEYGDTATEYEPFVGGILVDGTPEVLTVRGVNLCNPALYTGDGWYISANNTVSSAASNGTLVFPCKPNTTYSWWHTSGAGGARAFELTTDEVTAGQSATWAVGNPAYNDAMTVRKYTTSANAKLLCVLFARVADQVGRTVDEQLADFMLVAGDIEEAFAYQPYHEPQTVTDITDLFAVGNYADEQDIISGAVTHKVGVLVLDGTENWYTSDSFLSGMYNLTLSDLYAEKTNVSTNRKTPYCTHFARSTTWVGAGSRVGKIQAMTNVIGTESVIGLGYGTASAAGVADFKAWLASEYAAGTPVIVVYPLAEETTEQGTPHALHTTEGDNVVSVVSNVDPVQLECEYANGYE